MLESRPVYERPGYSTLIGRIRNNVRTYIRKQIELPKQEIAEILKANLNAVKWFGIAFAFLFLPGVYFWAGRGPRGREAAFLAIACWVVAIAFGRGIITGT